MARRGQRDRLDSEANRLEIIEAIHQQVQAEIATAVELRRQNDLAEKSLAELARNRAAEQQRVKLAFDTNDKVTGLLSGLARQLADIRRIARRLDEAERRGERTDDILLLLLTEHSSQKVEAAREDLEAEIQERDAERKKLLRQRKRNLSRLREQAASFGALAVPLDLQNRIEAEEAAIKELQG